MRSTASIKVSIDISLLGADCTKNICFITSAEVPKGRKSQKSQQCLQLKSHSTLFFCLGAVFFGINCLLALFPKTDNPKFPKSTNNSDKY